MVGGRNVQSGAGVKKARPVQTFAVTMSCFLGTKGTAPRFRTEMTGFCTSKGKCKSVDCDLAQDKLIHLVKQAYAFRALCLGKDARPYTSQGGKNKAIFGVCAVTSSKLALHATHACSWADKG